MARVEQKISGVKRTLDARPDRVDFRDREYRPPLTSLPPEYPTRDQISTILPQYVDAGLVLNQGSEGACTGFGLAALINYIYWERHFIARQSDPSAEAPERVSPRMLYHNARLYDEWDGEDYSGSSCRGAMKGWHKHGVCTDTLFPYDDNKFIEPSEGWAEDAIKRPLGAYYRVNALSIADMQAAIYETHAVYATAKVHAGWGLRRARTSADEEITINQGDHPVSGGHAFALVGYNSRGFYIQNSWGPGWGFNGFGLLPYEDWVRNGYDAWVAAIGAPVAPISRDPVPAARSTVPLIVQSGLADDPNSQARAGSVGSAVTPWSETSAYLHAVVSGNEGEILRRLQNAADAAHNLQLVFDNARKQIAKKNVKNIVLFAHGGLTSEKSAMRHVRKLGPYFEANKIHPIFFVWKTGILESLRFIGEDKIEPFREALDDLRAKGFVDDILESIREKRDRSFELAARQIVARAVWSEIKQNAEAAAVGDGSIRQVTRHVRELKQAHPEVAIHLVGYSAGSIWLGHMVDDFRQARLGKRGNPLVKTTTLWAPACTTAFANRQFGMAFDANVLTKGAFHVQVLTDEIERDDHVISEHVYGKSVLYLVSRALERKHKTPLLGLHLAWPENVKQAYADDAFYEQSEADVREWAAIAKKAKVSLEVISEPETSNGVATIPSSHTSFDNDVGVNTALMKRILGRKPRHAVSNLVIG